jgi:DNA-binding transcriptional MerR regulator
VETKESLNKQIARYLESSDVARTLGLVPASIRYHVKQGNLIPSATTLRGVCLFTEADLEGLRRYLAEGKRPR